MAQPIFDSQTKSYSAVEKENPKDDIRVIVGDDKDSSTFHPQLKISRWSNEVNFSARLLHSSIPGNVSYSDDGEKITWIKKQGQNEWKAIFYHRDDLDEGGYEFEIHLPQKPPVNSLTFSINTKELDYFYQPALTQQEIDEGAERPENVVGSYAVYHKTKGGMNDSRGYEYKCGKAFHIYRPHCVDSLGNETWGSLNVDEQAGTLTISVDQTWLDNAVYPVIVDPTFGYTVLGATAGFALYAAGTQSSNTNGQYYALGEAGTLDSIHIGTKATETANCDLWGAIYREDSAGADSHALVASAESLNVAHTTTFSFKTLTAASESLSVDDYIVAGLGNGEDLGVGVQVQGCYDTASANRNYYESTVAAGSYATRKAEDPWTEVDSSNTQKISMYATYTATGGTYEFVGSAEQLTTTDTSPITFAFTVPDLTNGLLVVNCIFLDNLDNTLSSPTWNSVAMGTAITKHTTTGEGWHILEQYYLVNPDEGAYTFSVSSTSTISTAYVVASWYSGALQTQGSVLDQTTSGAGATDPSISLTPGSAHELVVDAVLSNSNANLTNASGQIKIQDNGGVGSYSASSYVIQGGSASAQTMAWSGTDAEWDALAASYKQVAGAPPAGPTLAAFKSLLGVGF